MKRSFFSTEFLYSIFALILSVVVVHAIYSTIIRPSAAEHIASEKARMAADDSAEAEQSIYVMIRDYEQEACFILFFWAIAILGWKAVESSREQRLLGRDLVQVREGMRVLPEDSRELARQIQALPVRLQNTLLPRSILAALHRFESTRNIQDVSTAVHTICSTEQDRMDSELSMIRYIAWAIPSIGFIGTVRGIGQALGKAHAAQKGGDIGPVTESLGVAFNSTLIALFISIVLMFVVHQLQRSQDRLALDAEQYCDLHLIRHMQVNN